MVVMKFKKSMMILEKGEKIAFQDMIEIRMGNFLAQALPYKENIKKEWLLGGVRPNDDYFEGDADYEIRIIKKRK